MEYLLGNQEYYKGIGKIKCEGRDPKILLLSSGMMRAK